MFAGVKPIKAQSTSVELLGTITAKQASEGLGFNLDPNQDWQWAAAAAAGATHARMQCSWSAVEQQTLPPENKPASPQYVQDPNCVLGFQSAQKYGIHPTVVAAYGPPYHNIVTLAVPNGAQVGATAFEVELVAGVSGNSLENIKFPYDYICPVNLDSAGQSTANCSGQLSAKHSYPGTLITKVQILDATHAIVHLASALTKTLPSSSVAFDGCSMAAGNKVLTCAGGGFTPDITHGTRLTLPGVGRWGAAVTTVITGYISPTQVTVNLNAFQAITGQSVRGNTLYGVQEVLYPSAASSDPADASVVAYSNYVNFLAQDMGAHGLTGEVEIWNEPPWSNDPWDFRAGLYDAGTYPGTSEYGSNFGFAANLQNRTFPSGVTAIWNGTSGSSTASLLGSNMRAYSGQSLLQPATTITTESFHPYGNEPEQAMWNPTCLQGTAAGSKYPYNNPFANGMNCYLPGEPSSANLMVAVQLDMAQKLVSPSFGIMHSITETGIAPLQAGLEIPQARFIMRQYLGFQAEGVTPIEFYKLYDGNADQSYSFVRSTDNKGSYTPRPSYTALAGLMADLEPVSNAPIGDYSATTLASVTQYKGAFPLSTMHMVGTRSGARVNSEIFVLWQRTFVPCDVKGNCGVWASQLSPAPASTTVRVPAGMSVTSVVNLTTRAAVSYSVAGRKVTFAVADDPIEVIVDPAGAKAKLSKL